MQRAQFGTVSWMLPMDVYLGYQQTIVSKVSPSCRLKLSGQQNAVQLSVPQPPWLRKIQTKASNKKGNKRSYPWS
jgi:hypothetical protein